MSKFKYITEFEFRASPKVLYPYIATPSGLQQWFAKSVKLHGEGNYEFAWDGEVNTTKSILHKFNKHAKYDFTNGNYLDFKIETSELTGSTFLKITDFSDNDDKGELDDLWEELVYNLRVIVGN